MLEDLPLPCPLRPEYRREREAAFRVVIVLILLCAPRGAVAQDLQTFETKYYTIHTDISANETKEAAVRMTAMAEEYSRRTSDFSGKITSKFPFYLVRGQEEYEALGGTKESAGLFNGRALVVHVPDRANARTWHVLQHEGFHQFAAAVIGGQRPVWVNEGLAEYFGEAVFTGDGYVSGIIPQWRVERVKKEIRENQFRLIDAMMQMSLAEWNSKLSVINYDQGWSMVHFLAHGDGGKYRAAFTNFMIELGHNRRWQDAWDENFGAGPGGFEERWKAYWLTQPDDPTRELYAKATVATLTSFLARAVAQKQSFATFDEFIDRGKRGELKMPDEQWLPASLFDAAAAEAQEMTKKRGAQWSLVSDAHKMPQLRCRLGSGERLIASFTVGVGHVLSVDVKKMP